MRSHEARVALYGNFGIGNLGNECTLAAAIQGFSRHIERGRLFGIVADAAGLSAVHGIEGVAIDQAETGPETQEAGHTRPFAGRVFRRLAHEWRELRRARMTLRDTSALFVVGTGLLEDDTGALGWFIALFRWILAARLSGCQVGFVSVGAGPLRPGLPTLLVRATLKLAHYVSYRDETGRNSMKMAGVNVEGHGVVPDLAFSLPSVEPLVDASDSLDGRAPRVAIGAMEVEELVSSPGEREDCMQRMAECVVALVRGGAILTIVYGDVKHDHLFAEELLGRCHERLDAGCRGAVTFKHTLGWEDLVAELARQDVVVAARYHNQILALLQGKPMVALAYHPKSLDLAAQFGLEQCAEHLLAIDHERLTRHIRELWENRAPFAVNIRDRVACAKTDLSGQFHKLAGYCEESGAQERAARSHTFGGKQ